MIDQDLHTHSVFDDGKSTLAEMAEAALAAGLTSIGLCCHVPMPEAEGWCVPAERLSEFFAECDSVRDRYAGRLTVYRGVENDVLAETDLSGFDYIIGSAHFIPHGEGFLSVDESREISERVISLYGSPEAAAKVYFAQYSRIAADKRVNIVGHLDLLTKFNEPQPLFDPENSVYRRAVVDAMAELVEAGKIFEINTGAMSRGYRTAPYPSAKILSWLFDMGGRITVSSDAHSAKAVAHAFDAAAELAKSCGFTETWRYNGREFEPAEL